jgi:hypothetical protein
MHQTQKEEPGPARDAGSIQNNSTPGSFASLASIRRRFGTGKTAYEAAKAAWRSENPDADFRVHEAAMRQIARAVRF